MSRHPIVHVELSAQDRTAAGKFYQELFGWEMKHIPEMNYTLFDTGQENFGGGLNPITSDYPSGTVLVYVETEDLDETLRCVEKLGGKVLVSRTEIPGTGWFAHFLDTTGNKVGLLEPLKQA